MTHFPDFESPFLILKISYLSRYNLDCNLQHDSSPNPGPREVPRGHVRSREVTWGQSKIKFETKFTNVHFEISITSYKGRNTKNWGYVKLESVVGKNMELESFKFEIELERMKLESVY